MQKLINTLILLAIVLFSISYTHAGGGTAGGLASDFTKLHLTLLENTITAEEDLNALEPGLYEFVVTNNSGEKVEFVIQELKTEKVLGNVKVKPNKVKKSRVKLTKNGFRYRASEGVWHEHTIE